MIDSEKVRQIATEAIENEGAFLVDLTVGSDNRISISAGHPEGITLKKLGLISRAIEAHFDREEEDFEIEVSSPGVGQPFKVPQQYEANVGRPVKVVLKDGKVVKGELIAFENDQLTLSWKERVPKEVGKGKQTVSRKETISLENVKETRLEIRF